MKIFNLKKTSKPKSVVKPTGSVFGRLGHDPRVDWVVVVSLSFVVFVVLLSFSLSKYLGLDSNLHKQIVVTDSKDSSALDTVSLDAVLKKYSDRALLREEALNSYSSPQDPSI